MTRVPLEISGATTKANLAEAILKAAAQGHTSYNELLAAATDQNSRDRIHVDVKRS
jgi:hypothetical protein